MCKPVRDYLELIREYKDLVIMFVGLGMCFYVYNEYSQLSRELTKINAETSSALREVSLHLQTLKDYHARAEAEKNKQP